MSNTALHRVYNMTDPELCMFVSNLVGLMVRDAVPFEDLGVLDTDTTALQALGNAFEVFPDDGILQSNVSIAVEEKDAAREALLLSAKNVYNRALNKWGDKSAKYKSFGSIGIVSLSDLQFLFMTRRVLQQGTTYKTDLADQGLTQGMLDDLEDKAEAFEAALNAIKNAETERDMKTEERIVNGNELYGFAAKYCNMGKQIWQNVSEAKYNDYVIYQPSPGSLGIPQDFAFFFPEKIFSWSEISNATSYSVECSQDGGINYEEIYSGSEISFVFTPEDGTFLYRCRARNSIGYGSYCDPVPISYFSVLPPPSGVNLVLLSGTHNTILLSWVPVPTATTYKIYHCEVIFGDPPNNWGYVGSQSELEYSADVSAGKRHYYRLTAESPFQASVTSAEVWVEIAV